MRIKNKLYLHCCFLDGNYCRWKRKNCPVLYSRAGICESYRKGQAIKTSAIDEMRKTGVIPDGVGEIVPIPEEVKRESEESKKILASLYEKSFSVYANIFTLAIILRRDLYGDIAYCERVFEHLETSSFTPLLEPNIRFLSLLADTMNCPLSLFFSLGEENRKKAVYEVIADLKIHINDKRASYVFDADDDEITQKTEISIILEDLANGYEFRKNSEKRWNLLDDSVPYYEVKLKRSWDEEKGQCAYSFMYVTHWTWNFEYDNFNYMSMSGCEIYREYKGELADLIEQIRENEAPQVIMEPTGEDGSAFEIPINDSLECTEILKKQNQEQEHETHKIEKAEEKDSRGKIKRETLTKPVYKDTKTIDLLDEFEGIGENNPYVYEMLEIPHALYIWKCNKSLTISLIVKRCRESECVGDITFTEYKKDKYSYLEEYISKQITNEVLEKYQGKREIFYFDKPYHLRAQNSLNRIGYGWEWNWSGGVGDYIEGTMYGETTDYGFVGAYIT